MSKTKKILFICLIIASFFLYHIASQFAELVFDWFNIPITRDYGLTIPEFIAAGVAGLVFIFVLKNRTWMGFFSEAITELSKVTYPTRKEAGQSAVVVIILVAIATLFLALFDYIWSNFTQIILSN